MSRELVLADTSIWIEALGNNPEKILKETFEVLILENRLAMMPLISLELLSGMRSQQEFKDLSEELQSLEQLALTPRVWEQAAQWGFLLRRKGLSMPNTDLLIAAAAHLHHCSLWHQDKHFNLLAKQVDITVFHPA